MNLLMRKDFQDQEGTCLKIKAGAFKYSRGWMLKLMRLHQVSYKKGIAKK